MNIDLSSLAQLEDIDLSNNQFAKFPPALATLPKLSSLNLSGNQITALLLPDGALSQLQ
jgi:Leucine-rich repeat (LRR) protein